MSDKIVGRRMSDAESMFMMVGDLPDCKITWQIFDEVNRLPIPIGFDPESTIEECKKELHECDGGAE